MRVASLGNVSVVMMARAASCHASGAGRLGEIAEQVRELAGIQRLADHAGGGDVNLVGARSRRPWRQLRPSCGRFAPFLPVKALALPELTTSARALPLRQVGAAPQHRRRAGLGLVSTPAAVVPGSSTAIIRSVRPDSGCRLRRPPTRTPGTTGISRKPRRRERRRRGGRLGHDSAPQILRWVSAANPARHLIFVAPRQVQAARL